MNDIGAAEASRSHGAEGGGASLQATPAQPIPAPAGDPGPAGSPGVHAASRGSADGAATSLQTAPAVSDAGGGSFLGRGHPRRFTAAEDAIVRDAAAGRIGRAHAAKLLRTNYRTLALRIAALGEPVRHYKPGPKPSPLSDCPRGWFPIAHGGCGKWREYEGTPISIEAARAAVDAGDAAMAQVRIDGEFDLVFRVIRSPAASMRTACPRD